MPDSIASQAAVSAYNAARNVHGEAIVYLRGNDTVELIANPGQSTAEVADDKTGLVTEVDLQDWLLLASELKFGSEPVLPARGDRIVFAHDGIVDEYVVSHPDANHQCYKRSDPKGVVLRVHTLRRGSTVAPAE